MTLINLLVKDIIPFASDRNLDLHFITKLIDYRLTTIELNITSSLEVETYIDNVRVLNTLMLLLGILTPFSDKERTAYDNDILVSMLEEPSRLLKYKAFKLEAIKEHFNDEIALFEEYINLV